MLSLGSAMMVIVRPLALHLTRSASAFFKRSLEATATESHLTPLYASIALEHLLKAYLVEINPLLIVGKDDSLASHRWLADETKHEAVPPDRILTIGSAMALSHCTRFGLDLAAEEADLKQLMARRNEIVHTGHIGASPEAVLKLLPPLFTALRKLVISLNMDGQSFFGDWFTHVETAIGQRQEAISNRLDLAITAAKVEFKNRHGDLTTVNRRTLESSVRTLFETKEVEQQIVDCPACGLPSLVHGELDVVDWEVDYDRDGEPSSASPVIEYRAFELRCPSCGLRLDRELLDASGVMENWYLPSEDQDLFMEYYHDMWAGDEYYERDR